jgi:hypothetical protein
MLCKAVLLHGENYDDAWIRDVHSANPPIQMNSSLFGRKVSPLAGHNTTRMSFLHSIRV